MGHGSFCPGDVVGEMPKGRLGCLSGVFVEIGDLQKASVNEVEK